MWHWQSFLLPGNRQKNRERPSALCSYWSKRKQQTCSQTCKEWGSNGQQTTFQGDFWDIWFMIVHGPHNSVPGEGNPNHVTLRLGINQEPFLIILSCPSHQRCAQGNWWHRVLRVAQKVSTEPHRQPEPISSGCFRWDEHKDANESQQHGQRSARSDIKSNLKKAS